MRLPASFNLQKARLLLGIVACVALPSCRQRERPRLGAGLRIAAPIASAVAELVARPAARAALATSAVAPDLRALLDAWLEATNAANAEQLAELYMPQVGLYGRRLARAEAIARKLRAQARGPARHDELRGEPAATPQMAGRTRIEFVKRVTTVTESTDYEAYLMVGAHAGKLRIFEESDRATDVSLGTGPCEYVMRRTLQEFLGQQMPGIDGFLTSQSPERAGSSERHYEINIGFSADAGVFHNAGLVRVDPGSGAIQYDCWRYFYDFLPCRKLTPGVFQSVSFTATRPPAADPACAALLERLGRR